MASRKPAAAALAHQQGMSEKLARLKAKQPVRASYWVPLSEDTADELNEAEQSLSLARLRGEDTALAEKRLAKAQEAVKADSVELSFEAVPADVYQLLMRTHPPTDQEKEAQSSLGGLPLSDDFLYALAAVSCTEDITEDQLREVTAGWSFGEKQHMFSVVVGVNTSRRAFDLDALGK